MTDPREWPPDFPDADAAEKAERRKLIKAAEVELAKQARLGDLGKSNPYLEAATPLYEELHKNLMGAASSAIDRINGNAQFVQTVAAALASLYTGALALTFAIATNPLPLRGFIAPAFFAIAMAMAAIYLAYLTDTKGPDRPRLGDNWDENVWRRTTYFTNYVRVAANRRRGWLRAGVMALVVGVLATPAPWIDFGSAEPSAVAAEADREIRADDPPAPPSGNEEAGALLYAYQLQEYKDAKAAAERSTPAQFTVPRTTVTMPMDLALAIGALLVWLVLTLVVGAWVDSRASSSRNTPDPLLKELDKETP